MGTFQIPLVHRLLVLIPKAVAWLRFYRALQERVPKRWALSCHCLTIPFQNEIEYHNDRLALEPDKDYHSAITGSVSLSCPTFIG